MKVALVYDRVNKFGGAERVMQSLHEIFPEAPIYTLVYDSKKAGWAKGIKILPTFLNFIPWLRDKHELLSPIAPMAFETLNFDQYDLVISVTSSDAKSIITKPWTLHICYCLTPTRYFWSGKDNYSQDIKMRLTPEVIKKYLRTVDLLTSNRPDEYIAISEEVKDRISQYYHQESTVVYPAIDDKFYAKTPPVDKDSRKYYLVVSRLVPYKRTELVIEAFNFLQKRLIVIGQGSDEIRLKKLAMDNVEFVGNVDDEELIKYYSKAKAVIFPQDEDFGLVPIEAQACGTPVIAYAKGGALETVVSDKTGILFPEQSSSSIIDAVKRFENMEFNYSDCVSQAQKFSKKKFIEKFLSTVNNLYKKYLN
jgi:glycosyltransferase involved in cell wall biosynthesis